MMPLTATAALQAIPVRGRHGTAVVEFTLIAPVMVIMLLALFDIGVAAMQFISCYEALSGVAAYAMYNPPADVTNPGTWLSAELPSGTSVSVLCGGAACTSANASATPKSFRFSRSVTVSTVLLTSMAGTYTVTYSNRFQ
jgi:Flp pilus assembly protein TadG